MKVFNPFNFLLLGIPIYFAQGWLYPNGSIFAKFIVAYWLLLSIICTIKCLKTKITGKEGYILVLFLAIICLYWAFSPKLVGFTISTFNDYKKIVLVFISYFAFSYYSYKGYVNRWALFFFVSALLFVFVQQYYISERIRQLEFGSDQVTNNASYNFVMLFCLLIFSYKRQILQILAFLICLYFILLSAKRGAILTFSLQSIFFFYYYLQDKRRKNFIFTLFAICVIFVIVHYALQLYYSNDYLVERINSLISGEDNGSNRGDIYSSIWNKIYYGPLLYLFFGYGFDSSWEIIGGYAHNDWLEMLSCAGLFGCFLYLLIYVQFCLLYKKRRHLFPLKAKVLYIASLSSLGLISFFSMGYTSEYSFLFFALLGIIAHPHKNFENYESDK